jgi:hypothetical protein
MKKLSDVTAMVIDLGIFVEMARTLGKTCKKVYYCNPSWVSSFPTLNSAYVGFGFPEIEVVLSPFDHFEDIDLYIFPDVGHGRLQAYLESVGKAVWGCRMGEELEFERVACKQLMKSLGLPVGPYKVVKGMKALRVYLKEHKNVHVKIEKFRGSFETFKSKNYASVEPKLDEVEYKFGAFKEVVEFVVEDDLPDRFEAAIDCYNIDGQTPTKTLFGPEIKDLGYAAVFTDYNKIHKSFREFDKKIAPILEQYNYRSFYSPEMRIGKDQKAIMIDLCARSPSPPNELYQVFYKNLADIIWQGANGTCIDPDPISKWGVEILIHSDWATKNWQPVSIPKQYKDFVKLRNAVQIEGKLYAMPQVGEMPEIGSIVGYGNTLDAAKKMALEIAESVDGYYIRIPKESLDDADKEIEKAKEMGVWISE